MKKIFLAVPTSRFIETETFKTIYNLSIPDGYQAVLEIVQGYAVHQARNILVQKALEQQCDYIFWIDSDIILYKDILKCLIEDDKDIVTGYYIKKVEGQNICELFGTNPQDPNSEIIPNILEKDLPKVNGLYIVKACGFGCTLVKIDVFKKMLESEQDKLCFDYIWQKDKICSEDILFCKRAEALGYKTFVDTRFRCGHIGNKVF